MTGKLIVQTPSAYGYKLLIRNLLQAGRLNPHIAESYPLELGAEALAAVFARKVSGKLIIAPVPA
jgi:NADPH:quinone reductase-like Zn-dependent oxidoreductase